MKTKTPAAFLKEHKTTADTPSRRLADLLLDGAKACPYRFFPKPGLCKIVFKLGRLPSEDSDYVTKKLGSARQSANRILMREHRREIVSDMVEGLRATVNSEDLLKTRRRDKSRRVQSSVASLNNTNELIEPDKLSAAGRAEYDAADSIIRKLHSTALRLPQLTSGKDSKSKGSK